MSSVDIKLSAENNLTNFSAIDFKSILGISFTVTFFLASFTLTTYKQYQLQCKILVLPENIRETFKYTR